MSARLTAQQNKARLIAVFLFSVIVVLALRIYKGQFHSQASMAASNAETLDDSLFMGVRHVPAPEVRQVLPEAAGKAAVLYFGSRLCHDCQRMSPIVSQVMGQYPNMYFKKFDVLEDHAKAPAIFRAFKPVTVPMLVLINPKGEIRNVLYDYQKPEVVTAAINTLQRQAAASSSAVKSTSDQKASATRTVSPHQKQ